MLLLSKTINRLENVSQRNLPDGKQRKSEVKPRDGQQETTGNQQISHITQVCKTKEKSQN